MRSDEYKITTLFSSYFSLIVGTIAEGMILNTGEGRGYVPVTLASNILAVSRLFLRIISMPYLIRQNVLDGMIWRWPLVTKYEMYTMPFLIHQNTRRKQMTISSILALMNNDKYFCFYMLYYKQILYFCIKL
ncbi:hypothetical protein Cop2CBH44_08720 [Coprobacter secundus subsp. similis]|uniref:Uncharacterized protein n=2 Tax=Coprobacter secundus TaxID=1501392 RepID=A0A7G1HS31_9BACT|nr:hypothetical protein Cop2CBH44_08720 [Coprobacter secundus subsp. similis]